MMEATDGEELVREADEQAAPPNGGINEMLDVGQEDDLQEKMEEFLGPQPEHKEEEEERKYYRRKRLGVIKNVISASVAAMIVYSVYMGLLQMQLLLHYDMTYREVKYSNLGLEDIDRKMMMGINVTPIIALLYTPLLIRFLGTKWMMFLASGIYALFVSTNYWERYYTLVPSAVAIGAAIVPLWASLGHYMTRMAQQYYEYMNYKEEHVQEQKKLPKGACHGYIIVFHSVFHIIFNLSFVFAQLPMRLVLHHYIIDDVSHILCNVKACGAQISGWIPGFNTTILSSLPRSMLLIEVESVLMGFAFLAMIMFLVLCGPAYRPTEEIDLRSIGWGNIFQLPFKHHRDYRLRLLCPFFIYSGFEILFVASGFSLSYGVCALGLKNLWLIIMVYGFSASVFSSLSLSMLRLPRWVCLIGGAVVHGTLLVALLAFSPVPGGDQCGSKPNSSPDYLAPILIIAVLWGLGTALNKTGVGTLVGMLYAEEKERLDFVYTIYHWLQALAIFVVYLWSNMPMRAKLSILLATLLLACYCYWVMERRLIRRVPYRLPRIPRPRHKVKGYRYLEEDNSDESGLDNSDQDDEDDDDYDEEEDTDEDEEHVPGEEDAGHEEDDRRWEGDYAGGACGHDSPRGHRRHRRKGKNRGREEERAEEQGW